MRRSTFATLAGLTVVISAAPVHAQPTSPDDPWEHFNRRGFAIHQAIDHALIRHIAKIYRVLTPGPIGRGLHNLLVNLTEPVVAINDILQGRILRADVATIQFAVNSSIGIGGLFDVVAHVDPAAVHRDNSFSVTLGRWGVKPGPYLFIPLLGPSTVRDLLGGGIDASIDPFHWANYPGRAEFTTTRAIVAGVEVRARTGDELDTLLSGAADPYATLRSVYLQNRQSQIDGTDLQPINNLPDFDDTATPQAAPDATAPQSPAEPSQTPPSPEASPAETPAATPPGPVSSEVVRSSGGRFA